MGQQSIKICVLVTMILPLLWQHVHAEDLIVEVNNGQDLVEKLRLAPADSTVFVPEGIYDIREETQNVGTISLKPGVKVLGETTVEVEDETGRATGVSMDRTVILGIGQVNTRPWIALDEGSEIRGLTFRMDLLDNVLTGEALGVYGAQAGRPILIEECVFENLARSVTVRNVKDRGRFDIRIIRTVTRNPRTFAAFHINSGNGVSGGYGRLEFRDNYIHGGSVRAGIALFGALGKFDDPQPLNKNFLDARIENNLFDSLRSVGIVILAGATQSNSPLGTEASRNAVHFEISNNIFRNFVGVPVDAGMAVIQVAASRQDLLPVFTAGRTHHNSVYGSITGNHFENIGNPSVLDLSGLFRSDFPVMAWKAYDLWGGDSHHADVAFTGNTVTFTEGLVLARLFLNMGPDGVGNRLFASLFDNDAGDLGVLVAHPQNNEVFVLPGNGEVTGLSASSQDDPHLGVKTGILQLRTDAPWEVTEP